MKLLVFRQEVKNPKLKMLKSLSTSPAELSPLKMHLLLKNITRSKLTYQVIFDAFLASEAKVLELAS